MFYEMVTGRPPFVGDDAYGIIGQHINTPPVSPTWHRTDLPSGMEAIILQLLQKDPQKRPASTADILKALEQSAKAVFDRRSFQDRLIRPKNWLNLEMKLVDKGDGSFKLLQEYKTFERYEKAARFGNEAC